MNKYTDNPGLLFGKRIDFTDNVVTIKDKSGEVDTITCESKDEAKKLWADLHSAKFAAGISKKDTKYRQWFAHGEGSQRSSHSTGWTKTS